MSYPLNRYMTLKDKIHKLANEGYSYKEIATQLGCSKGTIAYHIGVGQKEKTAVRTRSRRSNIVKLIQEIKSQSPCKDCGEYYPYWIMQFDHLHLHNKAFNISAFRSATLSLDVVRAEIEKCDIVCSNCHANRSFKQRTKTMSDVGIEFCQRFTEPKGA